MFPKYHHRQGHHILLIIHLQHQWDFFFNPFLNYEYFFLSTWFVQTNDGWPCLPYLSSIWSWYCCESVGEFLAGPSPHFSLSVWWLNAVHSSRGGRGGSGFVFILKVWLKGPAPRLFRAWIRILHTQTHTVK